MQQKGSKMIKIEGVNNAIRDEITEVIMPITSNFAF